VNPVTALRTRAVEEKEANMKPIRKILFPVDLTEISKKLVPYVKTMTEKFNAEVHLLFAARLFEEFSGFYVPHPGVAKFEAEIAQSAEKKIAEFKEEFFSDCPSCKVKVVLGDAAEEILKYIQAENIDLVVMGTHGRKGLDRFLFGSVAEKVVKMSPVPVLSVNPFRGAL
jgi:nucleotide-binding universal stress UspA family protein